MSTTQIPPHEAVPASSEVESHVDVPVAENAAAAPAERPEWETPPDAQGPLTSLTASLGALILAVVALIVIAGVTGAVWVLVIGLIALVGALGLLIAVLMRFIN